MTPPLNLRPPEPADYATLASWVPDACACLHWAGPKLQFPFAPAQLPGLLAMPGASSQVMSRDSAEALETLGFGQFWMREAGAVHLGRIIVNPGVRGQGLGKTLCELLIAQARRATGADTFTLRVYRDNLAAHAIYMGLGFVAVPGLSDEKVLAMRKGAIAFPAGLEG